MFYKNIKKPIVKVILFIKPNSQQVYSIMISIIYFPLFIRRIVPVIWHLNYKGDKKKPVTICDQIFLGVDFCGQSLEHICYKQCKFINCSFRGAKIGFFKGCEFKNCELAGLQTGSISSSTFDDGYSLYQEWESALLGCSGVGDITFCYPHAVRVFVSPAPVKVRHREINGPIAFEEYWYYSKDEEKYLKFA